MSRFHGILPIPIYLFALFFNVMLRCALKPKQIDIIALIPHFMETETKSLKFQEINTRLWCGEELFESPRFCYPIWPLSLINLTVIDLTAVLRISS